MPNNRIFLGVLAAGLAVMAVLFVADATSASRLRARASSEGLETVDLYVRELR